MIWKIHTDGREKEVKKAMLLASKRRAEVEQMLNRSELYEDAMMDALRDRGYRVTRDCD